MQVSFMWLCCLSKLSPALGPKVVSEAGEPASPNAAAEAKTIIVAGAEKPSLTQIGTNKTAKIGIVPKDVPIPIVIKSPSKSISAVAKNFECSIKGMAEFIKDSIEPLCCKTSAKPAAVSITKAT